MFLALRSMMSETSHITQVFSRSVVPLSVSLRLEPFGTLFPPLFSLAHRFADIKTALPVPLIQICKIRYSYFITFTLRVCMTQLTQVVCQGMLTGCLPDIPPFGSVTHRLRFQLPSSFPYLLFLPLSSL
jgi:hypothetical protein